MKWNGSHVIFTYMDNFVSLMTLQTMGVWIYLGQLS